MNILVLGAGGNAGVGMTRCLSDFKVFGSDSNPWAKKLMEVPEWKGEEYDLKIVVPSKMILKDDHVKTFLPTKEEIDLCWDKAKCAEALGYLAPKTYWVRDTTGSGGKGAQMCSEYLPGRNISCEMVYYNGTLAGYFMKHRLSYSTGGVQEMVAGVGTSMVSTCIDELEILSIADRAVGKVSKKPNGIFSVDLRENEAGEPKVTEINAGRFLTASYIYYHLTTYNLPRLYVELALGLDLTPLGEMPVGKSIIRQLDRRPWIGEL